MRIVSTRAASAARGALVFSRVAVDGASMRASTGRASIAAVSVTAVFIADRAALRAVRLALVRDAVPARAAVRSVSTEAAFAGAAATDFGEAGDFADILATDVFAADAFAAEVLAAEVLAVDALAVETLAAEVRAAEVLAADVLAVDVFAAEVFAAEVLAFEFFAAEVLEAFAADAFETVADVLDADVLEAALLAVFAAAALTVLAAAALARLLLVFDFWLATALAVRALVALVSVDPLSAPLAPPLLLEEAALRFFAVFLLEGIRGYS